jgi:hypothetical protein
MVDELKTKITDKLLYGWWTKIYPNHNFFIPNIIVVFRTDLHKTKIKHRIIVEYATKRIPFSSTNKTDRYDITAILLKVALSTISLNHPYISMQEKFSRTGFTFQN